MKKIISIILVLMLIVTGIVIGETIKVPQDYATIQEAIDNAQPGDTIFIDIGTYNEEVTIDKGINIVGKDRNKVIIDRVLVEESTYVNISELTIKNLEIEKSFYCVVDDVVVNEMHIEESTHITVSNSLFIDYEQTDGLIVQYSQDCYITGNDFQNYWVGLCLKYENDNIVIDNNVVTGCTFYGVEIEDEGVYEFTNNSFYACGFSGGHHFSGQTMVDNTVNDLPLLYYDSQDDLVLNGTLIGNIGQLILVNCNNAVIENFRMDVRTDSIIVTDLFNMTIKKCNITDATRGIYLSRVYDSTIKNNIFINSSDNAIEGHGCDNITLIENDIDGTCEGGVHIFCENTYKNNNFRSREMIPALDTDGESLWFNNYWDDYTGVDIDGDGFGDTPYYVPGGYNTDESPRINYYSWDDEPPVTTATIIDIGEKKPEIYLYLEAKDKGIGLCKIHYRECEKHDDWGKWKTVEYNYLAIDLKGIVAVEYFSDDDRGNKENIHQWSTI